MYGFAVNYFKGGKKLSRVLDVYPNLPGILTEFKDGGLQYRDSDTDVTTGSILLLGTAVDGPIMEPVAVDGSTFETVFGRGVFQGTRLPNGATLPLGFGEAFDDGSRDIRMMRISGSVAGADLECDSIEEDNYIVHEDIFTDSVPGNQQATFELPHKVVGTDADERRNAVTIFANGMALTKGSDVYNVGDQDKSIITLEEDKVDANADIFIEYGYNSSISQTDAFTGDDAKAAFELSETPSSSDNGDFTVKVNGISNTEFTVNIDDTVGTLTFDDAPADDATIEITYNYYVFMTNGIAGSDIIQGPLAPADQEFDLTHTPETEYADLILTANDDTILVPPEMYTVNIAGKKVILKPFLPMGATVAARYPINTPNQVTPLLELKSYFGGTVYNEIEYSVVHHQGINKKIIIEKPSSKKIDSTEPPLEYSTLDYPTLYLLQQGINEDPRNGIIQAEVPAQFHNIASMSLITKSGEFENGADGTNISKESLYTQLLEAYDLLENYNVDYIVPLGVFADDNLIDSSKNFANQLALACAAISNRTSSTLGVIATTSPTRSGLLDVRNHVNHLMSMDNSYVMRDPLGNIIRDEEGNPFDLGRYIYVLGGPDRLFFNSRIGRYSANSPSAFAATLTTLSPMESALNRTVNADQGLRYTFSNPQRNSLVGHNFVVYKTKGEGTQYRSTSVEDEITAAPKGSDYHSGSVIRQVTYAVNRIRIAVEPFLGQAPNRANQNSLTTMIDKVISDELVESGVIMPGSNFRLIATPRQRTLGETDLELVLIPSIVRRRINIKVSLSA